MVKKKKGSLPLGFPVGTDWSPLAGCCWILLIELTTYTTIIRSMLAVVLFLPRIHVPIILYQWGFSPGYLSRTGLVSAKKQPARKEQTHLMLEPWIKTQKKRNQALNGTVGRKSFFLSYAADKETGGEKKTAGGKKAVTFLSWYLTCPHYVRIDVD